MSKAKATQPTPEQVAAVLVSAVSAPSDNETLRIPVSRTELYFRLDEQLRLRNRALLKVPMVSAHVLDPTDYELYEAELADNGRVRRIDLKERAIEMGCLAPNETVVNFWA